MLYFLYLLPPNINLFQYISVRAGGALLTSFLICLLFGNRFIAWLKSKQAEGQPIRSYGPENHLKKKGTPTMGGLLMLISVAVSTFLWGNLANPYIWILLFSMFGFGLLGFIDDYTKLTEHSAEGISSKAKLVAQFSIALITCVALVMLEKGPMATTLSIPYLKNVMLDLGWFYIPFAMVVLVGASNAVNLTDGLDGLVSFPLIMSTFVFMIISYLVGRIDYSEYLLLHYVFGAGEMTVFGAAMIGSLIGFLWFNAYPARMFMGDTGSLAFGGVLGTIAVAVKHEIILGIAGGLFVIEALSVMIQLLSWKYRHKPFFKMAPIHHHFEKMGIPETTLVVRFWMISILLALIALASLKIR